MAKRARDRKKTKAEKRAARARRSRATPSVPPFHGPFEAIVSDFDRRGITLQPGFCDHAAFVAVEKSEPRYLHNYARYVCERTYDINYLERAEPVIRASAFALHSDLKQAETPGACAWVSMQLTRLLDELGIWNCQFSGSFHATFPNHPGTPGVHFPSYYTDGKPNSISYHSWICAPPFRVVDLSIGQQHYLPGTADLLLDIAFATEPLSEIATAHDLIDQGSIRQLTAHGEDLWFFLLRQNPDLPTFLQTFRGTKLTTDTTRILYHPTAVNGCSDPIQAMKTLTGRPLLDLLENEIRPRLA